MHVAKEDFPAWVTALTHFYGLDCVDEEGLPHKGDWQRLMELLRDANLTPEEKESALTIIEHTTGGREAAETWLTEP